jgi:hypothetical protein
MSRKPRDMGHPPGEAGPVRVNDWTALKIHERVTFTSAKPKTG